jgi:hypothetical protein
LSGVVVENGGLGPNLGSKSPLSTGFKEQDNVADSSGKVKGKA